jgi:hypothetical protein
VENLSRKRRRTGTRKLVAAAMGCIGASMTLLPPLTVRLVHRSVTTVNVKEPLTTSMRRDAKFLRCMATGIPATGVYQSTPFNWLWIVRMRPLGFSEASPQDITVCRRHILFLLGQ